MKKKHRARVLEFFIDVARECFNIGNFNSLMAIISKFNPDGFIIDYNQCSIKHQFDTYHNLFFNPSAGMNMSPVSRLRKTWAKVNTDKFEILEVYVVKSILKAAIPNLFCTIHDS